MMVSKDISGMIAKRCSLPARLGFWAVSKLFDWLVWNPGFLAYLAQRGVPFGGLHPQLRGGVGQGLCLGSDGNHDGLPREMHPAPGEEVIKSRAAPGALCPGLFI